MTIDYLLFRWRWLRGWGPAYIVGRSVAGAACWLPVLVCFGDYVATIASINGPSMYPYFNEGINRTTRPYLTLNRRWNSHENLERGMIVTFYSPFNPEVTAVKRVIAIEGDVVQTRPPAQPARIVVPSGHIWVEGDGEADKSLDSNTYGPISTNLITGRITYILHPLNRFGPVVWPENSRRLNR